NDASVLIDTRQSLKLILDVVDIQGRIVGSQELVTQPGSNRVELGVQYLSAGIYSLVVRNEKGIMTRKLIKH
ncbi:MAG: T9SS type A sorting domain-containing protein, partial [Flavobacteriales bacterium]|nr:T9SS type A sorting domain-containing protein [Flavobacteriales bacterium]